MQMLRLSSSRAVVIVALFVLLALGPTSFAQAPALPEQLISAAEAHAIIEGAFAYARGKNLRLGAVVVDTSGELIAGERMDGAPGRNIMMATANAFTSVMYRTTTQSV